jgi:predicted ATPase
VASKANADLASALDRLIEAGLLFRQGVPPYATYLFKHALVQDAAYGTLLREPRRALHARVAEALRDRFTTIADAEPEVVAHHFTQAALAEAGIEWWSKAGKRALRTSAFEEAIAHLEKARGTGRESCATAAPTTTSDRLRSGANPRTWFRLPRDNRRFLARSRVCFRDRGRDRAVPGLLRFVGEQLGSRRACANA